MTLHVSHAAISPYIFLAWSYLASLILQAILKMWVKG